ncbi:site-specific DNA-methyltransferase [Streptomyces sp. NBC_00433]
MSLPLDAERYHPDPREPVDRWFQTASASNVRTTTAVVADLVSPPCSALVDPFAGGGSSAMAARLMNLPFFGIEIDPVLACVALAKSRATVRHARLLRHLPPVHDLDSLLSVLEALPGCGTADDVAVASCLAVVMGLRASRGSPLGHAEVTGDLVRHQPPAASGRLLCADATAPSGWLDLPIPEEGAVLYTSPQFGQRSPLLDAPPRLVTAARGALAAAGADRGPAAAQPDAGFAETTVAMLSRAAAKVRRATVVIEHEPDDDGRDATGEVLEHAAAAIPGRVHDARVIVCGQFTWRGPLSLIVFDLR